MSNLFLDANKIDTSINKIIIDNNRHYVINDTSFRAVTVKTFPSNTYFWSKSEEFDDTRVVTTTGFDDPSTDVISGRPKT